MAFSENGHILRVEDVERQLYRHFSRYANTLTMKMKGVIYSNMFIHEKLQNCICHMETGVGPYFDSLPVKNVLAILY